MPNRKIEPPASDYGPEYYRNCCGEIPYERNSAWLAAFANIAARIKQSLAPRTVLDVGCGMGMLVECLWDLGICAEGFVISQYAISQVRRDMAPHCHVRSVADRIDGRWDLIVCIEVLEHVTPDECNSALDNFASATDQLLFSSTPLDLEEKTHINVKPIREWLDLFKARGFYPVSSYDASYISPQSMLLRRNRPVPDSELDLFARAVMDRCIFRENARKLQECAERLVQTERTITEQAEQLARLQQEYSGQREAWERRLTLEETATNRLDQLIGRFELDLKQATEKSELELRRRQEQWMESMRLLIQEAMSAAAASARQQGERDRAEAELSEWRDVCKARELELELQRRECTRLTQELNSAQVLIGQQGSEIAQLQSELHRQRTQLLAELADAKGRLETRQSEFQARLCEVSRLADELDAARRSLADRTEENIRLRTDLREAKILAEIRAERDRVEQSRAQLALASARNDRRHASFSIAPRRGSLLFESSTLSRVLSASLAAHARHRSVWRLTSLQVAVHTRVIMPLIDPQCYRPIGMKFDSAKQAARHYLREGFKSTESPNAIFDPNYYLHRYPDVAASGMPPLLHYALFGYAEDRQPGPLFHPEHYRMNTSNPVGAGDPLAHFLANPDRAVSPSPLFDCAYFLMLCPAARSDPRHPLLFYLTEPKAWMSPPHPLFDPAYYCLQAPQTDATRLCPLVHFVVIGAALGKNPHPLFDVSFYRAGCDPPLGEWENPLVHFIEQGAINLRAPHLLFDPNYYCSHHSPSPELLRNPLIHYLLSPPMLRKSPHPLFDLEYYATRYADRMELREDPLSHYIRIGAWEGCEPNPDFATQRYVEAHPDVRQTGETPLAHYARQRSAAPPSATLSPQVLNQNARVEIAVEPFTQVVSRSKPRLTERTADASVIVAVHNALDDVRRCLSSVLQYTLPPYELILIDDGSSDETRRYLEDFSYSQGARLVRNDVARGYVSSLVSFGPL